MQSTNKSQSQYGATASRSSILGLDLLTFLMADVRDGVGPYLSVFLKGGLHWQSGEIGIAMASSSITAAICQIPAGLLVDSLRAKRLLVVISGLLVGLGCLLVVCVPKLIVVVSAQATLGAASAIIPPALAALSLGIVGRKLFPTRVSRNESFNHGGNFAAAILADKFATSILESIAHPQWAFSALRRLRPGTSWFSIIETVHQKGRFRCPYHPAKGFAGQRRCQARLSPSPCSPVRRLCCLDKPIRASFAPSLLPL